MALAKSYFKKKNIFIKAIYFHQYFIFAFVVSVLPVPAGPAGAPPNFKCNAPVSVR
jgi:hypothetical protein